MIGRNDILSRFEQWLDSSLAWEQPPPGIPDEILTGEEIPAEEGQTDLYTMWAAVTALTQEVKLQGRSFKQLSETLDKEYEVRGEKQMLNSLLDLRERLLRGLESMRTRAELQPTFVDRIFRSRWLEIQRSLEVVRAMENGYRMTLASMDDLLAGFEVQPIDCLGQPFDPQVMNAVDIEETDDAEEGKVLAVYRTGYERNGEVYRPAQVRVAAQRQRKGISNE